MFWEKGIQEYNSLLTGTSTQNCANTLDSICMKLFTYRRSRTQKKNSSLSNHGRQVNFQIPTFSFS